MTNDLKTLIVNYARACNRDAPFSVEESAESRALDDALAALAPADLDTRAESAAKALERERCNQFEWSDEEFEIWWSKDERCKRADRIAEARFILLAAPPAKLDQQPADPFASPVNWPAPLTDERILEIRNQVVVPVSEKCAGYDALWIRAARAAIAEAHACTAVSADAAFDLWYAGQRHQLVNEQVCRLIWTRAWELCLAALRAGALQVDTQRFGADIALKFATQGAAAHSSNARLESLPQPAPELLKCLQRLANVCADATADGRTESKEDIQTLAEIGAVRLGPFGRTYMTDYGRWLISATHPDQNGTLLTHVAARPDLLDAVLPDPAVDRHRERAQPPTRRAG